LIEPEMRDVLPCTRWNVESTSNVTEVFESLMLAGKLHVSAIAFGAKEPRIQEANKR
jgi:hypothetical protein